MCVKARAYKSWTVLKGKWTGHIIVLSRRNPRDSYPKHVSRWRNWAPNMFGLRRRGRSTRVNKMETGLILERTEQEGYFCNFSMMVAQETSSKDSTRRSFVYEFIYIFSRGQNSEEISSFEDMMRILEIFIIEDIRCCCCIFLLK